MVQIKPSAAVAVGTGQQRTSSNGATANGGHAAATTFLLLLSNIAIAVFARWQFPEVRVRFQFWFDRNRLKQMFSFSSFLLFGTLGTLFGNSGVAVVLNAFFGPAANAAMGFGNLVF